MAIKLRSVRGRTRTPQEAAFDDIASRYLEESFSLFPQSASRLGLEEFNHLLGDNLVATHQKHIRLLEATLAEVEALPEFCFSGDAWLDRRAFLAQLRSEYLSASVLQRWRTNPQTHSDEAVDSLFDLVVRYSASLGKILPAIEARLEKIPDFLAAALECVKLPVPLWTSLAVRSCEGAKSFLAEIESALLAVSPHAERTRSLLHSAGAAFDSYARGIQKKRSGPVNGFSIGRGHFEFLMRERLGVDWSLPEAEAMGHHLVGVMEQKLREEARKFGRKSAREIIEQAAQAWAPEAPLLDEYRTITTAIKRKLAEKDLVSLPKGESCDVLPAPPFLKHQFPTAAYNAPPPWSSRQVGIFWVNDLSLEASSPKAARAEVRQHFGLELTSAHEAYPGHHLQFAIQNRHPSKLRRLFAHAIFYEGWTMWCEKLSVEHGLVDLPEARLVQLHDALWRAHRIVIDCGLHSGKLSFQAACKRLQKGVGFTQARAAGDVNWYTSSPTVPMSYLLGRLEVEKLHERFVTQQGWSLRQFNDWMLSHGTLPWSWILQARVEK